MSTWILVSCLVLVAVAIVFFSSVNWYRRHWLGDEESSSEPWTLDDLRRLRADGSLTQEEYEQMRAVIDCGVQGRRSAAESPIPALKSRIEPSQGIF